MDLFADDDTDNFAAGIALIPKLKQMLPGLKVTLGFS